MQVKDQLEAYFRGRIPASRERRRPGVPAVRAAVPANGPVGRVLRVFALEAGVGLDFVGERGYGRRRWLKYPAQAKQ
jgi:hypothetical protein